MGKSGVHCVWVQIHSFIIILWRSASSRPIPSLLVFVYGMKNNLTNQIVIIWIRQPSILKPKKCLPSKHGWSFYNIWYWLYILKDSYSVYYYTVIIGSFMFGYSECRGDPLFFFPKVHVVFNGQTPKLLWYRFISLCASCVFGLFYDGFFSLLWIFFSKASTARNGPEFARLTQLLRFSDGNDLRKKKLQKNIAKKKTKTKLCLPIFFIYLLESVSEWGCFVFVCRTLPFWIIFFLLALSCLCQTFSINFNKYSSSISGPKYFDPLATKRLRLKFGNRFEI